MNLFGAEVPQPLSLLWQERCRQVLALRSKCRHEGACYCISIETLLRWGKDGKPLYKAQRQYIESLLRGTEGGLL